MRAGGFHRLAEASGERRESSMNPGIGFVAAVNDRDLLRRCLLSSPDLASTSYPVSLQEGFKSAALALNKGISELDCEYVVCVHQDVYLPSGWVDALTSNIESLSHQSKRWAVLGVIGLDAGGAVVGQTFSTDVMTMYGQSVQGPTEVTALDECVLVINRREIQGLDPGLPHFHLYAADLILTAREHGKSAFVIDAPVLHHSVPVRTLRGGYTLAYRYMQRKWAHRLPWPTLIAPLIGGNGALLAGEYRLYKARLKRFIQKLTGNSLRNRDHLNPVELARTIGIERQNDESQPNKRELN